MRGSGSKPTHSNRAGDFAIGLLACTVQTRGVASFGRILTFNCRDADELGLFRRNGPATLHGANGLNFSSLVAARILTLVEM